MAPPSRTFHAALHHPRLIAAALLGLLLALVLHHWLGLPRALLLAFDLASFGYLGSIAVMMARTPPQALARRAERQLRGRWTVLLLSALVSAMVLLALRVELQANRASPGSDLALAGASIVLSWLFFSAVFAQAYAHADHLERRAGQAGLIFPNSALPDYWDYLYFAIVLSMTFQTSDVSIAGRALRHMVLLHSVVAFFFNVFIIALTVNVVAGVL